jgi:3-oxoacyl-[acyl-carrier-protein] synthase II
MSRKVVITGLGVLSPIGLTVADVAASLASARSGIGLIEAPPLRKSFPAGVIRESFEHEFTRLELPFLDRSQHMAILAARQAIQDAGFDNFAGYGIRSGLYYGNVNGGVSAQQGWYRNLLVEGKQASRPFSAMAIMSNGGAAQISIRHGIVGPVVTHASACGSSGVAIGEAARAIRDGHLDIAVAGGAEAPLIASLIGVFDGTRALAAPNSDDVSRSCRPFSADRAGLVLGEGAAFLVLESEEGFAAREYSRNHYGYLTGYGISSDAYHIGMPQSQGQARALTAALVDAGIAPDELDYLNAHATATHGGDVIESDAIRMVFGDSPDSVRVSSTKSVHGHLLGATSALELLITVVAMNESMLPATAHLENVDPKCTLNHVAGVPVLDRPVRNAMSFSCGFGGTNVALVVSRASGRS